MHCSSRLKSEHESVMHQELGLVNICYQFPAIFLHHFVIYRTRRSVVSLSPILLFSKSYMTYYYSHKCGTFMDATLSPHH